MTKTVSHSMSVSDLLQAKAITRANLDAAIEAFLANPKIGPFELAAGYIVDLTAAVKADRHATAILTEPTAKGGSRRAAVKSALLRARPLDS
ncbi:hypothetical protein [Methylobacterium longum]|uniref:Uncharacterized protein n=1 Tax=Methylobacterium longum TaxID=767694 RepID=A0ABT8AKB2_9HYPH|nr:hypothetical protein [Methylobacterium longum]MDN3569819.1 hypothetical protein [Methylobacterium longum]GJE13227.1 hypothetical protein FOHLNKBM_4290 [Methylobacterium longum]